MGYGDAGSSDKHCDPSPTLADRLEGHLSEIRKAITSLADHHEQAKYCADVMAEEALAASTVRSAGRTRDTERLDALEALLWSKKIGNGVAIFPSVLSATKERRIALQDLGDEDGSDLGDDLTASHPSLRDALDELLGALATPSPVAPSKTTDSAISDSGENLKQAPSFEGTLDAEIQKIMWAIYSYADRRSAFDKIADYPEEGPRKIARNSVLIQEEYLRDELRKLATRSATASRKDIIEEAASTCEGVKIESSTLTGDSWNKACDCCAKNVRDLLDSTTTKDEP